MYCSWRKLGNSAKITENFTFNCQVRPQTSSKHGSNIELLSGNVLIARINELGIVLYFKKQNSFSSVRTKGNTSAVNNKLLSLV